MDTTNMDTTNTTNMDTSDKSNVDTSDPSNTTNVANTSTNTTITVNPVNSKEVDMLLFLLKDSKNIPTLDAYLKINNINFSTLMSVVSQNRNRHSDIEKFLIEDYEGKNNCVVVVHDVAVKDSKIYDLQVQIAQQEEKIGMLNTVIENLKKESTEKDSTIYDLRVQIAQQEEKIGMLNAFIEGLKRESEQAETDKFEDYDEIKIYAESLEAKLTHLQQELENIKKDGLVIVNNETSLNNETSINHETSNNSSNTETSVNTKPSVNPAFADTNIVDDDSPTDEYVAALEAQCLAFKNLNTALQEQVTALENQVAALEAETAGSAALQDDFTKLQNTLKEKELAHHNQTIIINKYLQNHPGEIGLMRSIDFEIYRETFEKVENSEALFNSTFKNPKSVLNLIQTLLCRYASISYLIQFAQNNKFDNYETIIKHYLTNEQYFEDTHLAELSRAKELLKAAKITTFERDFELAKARYILKKYAE